MEQIIIVTLSLACFFSGYFLQEKQNRINYLERQNKILSDELNYEFKKNK